MDSIWIQTNTSAYKTGETVTVIINGTTVTPVQGFTAQISFDPDCLQPVNGTSRIPGMNGLVFPQTFVFDLKCPNRATPSACKMVLV